MTNAEILKPLVQMMMDVSNGKGQFEKTDLEVISANAVAIQAIIAQDSGISARQAMDMWNAARQVRDADVTCPARLQVWAAARKQAPGHPCALCHTQAPCALCHTQAPCALCHTQAPCALCNAQARVHYVARTCD